MVCQVADTLETPSSLETWVAQTLAFRKGPASPPHAASSTGSKPRERSASAFSKRPRSQPCQPLPYRKQVSEAPLRTQTFLAISQTHGSLAGDLANPADPWQLWGSPPWDTSPLDIPCQFCFSWPSRAVLVKICLQPLSEDPALTASSTFESQSPGLGPGIQRCSMNACLVYSRCSINGYQEIT